MTHRVIYQVYLEICLGYYISGNIPGIYHEYLTSTDSRCVGRPAPAQQHPPPPAGHDVAGQGLHFDLHWQGLQSRPWRP